MRACLLRHPGRVETKPLHLEDVPKPTPASDEVLIRVSCCGVCRTDLHVIEGELPSRRPMLIPGHQVVGEVVTCGPQVSGLNPGDRVGAAWLRRTCGRCRFCLGGRENLCDTPEFNGWTADGGYAEFMTVPAAFAYPMPAAFPDIHAAPLLCAGIIGYRSLKLTGLLQSPSAAGARLGIYGFGAAGHVVIQLARSRGIELFVCSRDRGRHQSLASELGASWVGGADEQPPRPLDAAIVFAPAGELVPTALKALDKGGSLVLGGIHMSPIPSFDYQILYNERVVRSVANNTRDDGHEFLKMASSIPVHTQVQTFPLDQAPEALIALKHDAIRGAAVITI